MRNITTRLTTREMYELVRDDSTILEIKRALDDLNRQKDFEKSYMDNASESVCENIETLKKKLDARVEEIFRARLDRLDKGQLISLIMTGEFPIEIRTVGEAGILRSPEAKPLELFDSKSAETVAKGRFGRRPTVAAVRPAVSVPDDVVEVPFVAKRSKFARRFPKLERRSSNDAEKMD